MTPLYVLLALYLVTAAADVYTTKRAILDHYHGWKLGVWERNPLLRKLWGLVGINAQNAFREGTDPEGVATMIVHKAVVGAGAWALWLWSPPVAIGFLAVLSALQAWAAKSNRDLLRSKRRYVDARR